MTSFSKDNTKAAAWQTVRIIAPDDFVQGATTESDARNMGSPPNFSNAQLFDRDEWLKNIVDHLMTNDTNGVVTDSAAAENIFHQTNDALAAKTSQAGIVSLATSAETTAGSVGTKAVTPSGLDAMIENYGKFGTTLHPAFTTPATIKPGLWGISSTAVANGWPVGDDGTIMLMSTYSGSMLMFFPDEQEGTFYWAIGLGNSISADPTWYKSIHAGNTATQSKAGVVELASSAEARNTSSPSSSLVLTPASAEARTFNGTSTTAPSGNTTHVFAHGLGGKPRWVEVRIRRTGGNLSNSWNTGDEVYLRRAYYVCGFSASQIHVRLVPVPQYHNKLAQTQTLNANDWALVVSAGL